MRCLKRAAATLIMLSVSTALAAFDTSRIEDPEVRECAERALPAKTASQIQRVEVVGKNGHVVHQYDARSNAQFELIA